VWQRHSRTCPVDSEGAVLPHRCRGAWSFTLDAGRTPAGTRRRITKSGFSTRREAQQALSEEAERVLHGVRHDRALTVEAYLKQWLQGKRQLRDNTRRNYEIHIRLYLAPALGQHRIQELRDEHIDQLYDDLLSGRYVGATAATAHHVHRTLRSALNTAVKRRLIVFNPALHVELPEHRKARAEVWEPQDVATFLTACRSHRLSALFHLLAYTGMRRGEAIGLHWADVDLERAHVRVYWQITDAGKGLRLGAPKTASGNRVVPLDRATVEVLRRHRGRQQNERAAWGEGWEEHGLVFTRENGGLLRPDTITHLFAVLVKEAGVPRIRLHDLRHTHATLALSAGVDIKVVSDRLGHSTSVITRDLYTHVVPALARSAADSIAAAVPYVPEEGGSALAAQQPLEGAERGPPESESAGQTRWPGAGSNR